MLGSKKVAAVRRAVVAAAVAAAALVAAPAAGAHTGGSNCDSVLAKVGSTYEGKCEFPFQGWPIGVAGLYQPGESARGSEIHVEVHVKAGLAPARPMGIECEQVNTSGDASCEKEDNPFGSPLTLPESLPLQAMTLVCLAHSHAQYSNFYPPSGEFACWSTDEARADLVTDGRFPGQE